MDFVSKYLTETNLTSSESWFYARKINLAATQEWADYIAQRGVDAWLEEQLNPEGITESPSYERERKALFPSTFTAPSGNKTLDKTFWDTYQPSSRRSHPYEVSVYVLESALHRLWASKKQLQANMALFWADVLAATIEKAPDGYHDYIAMLFDGALGKYKDLLYNIATSQTMAIFLDNNTNTQFALNENMGRELMELHSWGPEKGYSQEDVISVSKLLTGLGANVAEKFTEAKPELHYFGELTVAGKTFANSGSTTEDIYKTVRELTDHLASDRFTGLRLARRLIQYFIGQDGDYEALAQRLATTYTSNDTEIRPVLRELLTSQEFKNSGGQTIRRPWAVLCSMLASGKLELKGYHDVSNPDTITAPLYKMFLTLKYDTGGMPFDAPATNGYPLDAEEWINSVCYAGLSSFNRYANYVSKWDGDSVDSLANWANPITWSSCTGIEIGKTSLTDAAKAIFQYLSGYEANSQAVVDAIALYATARDEQTVLSASPSDGTVESEEQVQRMVEAAMTAPHMLIS